MNESDFQPFPTVDDEGFRGYSHALIPKQEHSLVPQVCDGERASLPETLQQLQQFTREHTADIHSHHFLYVTLLKITEWSPVVCCAFSDRHTSDNLAEDLLNVTTQLTQAEQLKFEKGPASQRVSRS